MMLFEDFDTYRKFITANFGEDFYADDNAVVGPDSGEDVATLWVVEPGKVRIDYCDGTPSKIVALPGCRK